MRDPCTCYGTTVCPACTAYRAQQRAMRPVLRVMHAPRPALPPTPALPSPFLGRYLRQVRHAAGLSYLAASDAWGIPATTLRRWEQGAVDPHVLLRELARILGITRYAVRRRVQQAFRAERMAEERHDAAS